MQAVQETTRNAKAAALAVVLSLGVGLVGRFVGLSLPPAPGLAVERFFDVLSAGILAHGIGDQFFPTRLSPRMLVLRRWMWLSIAVGLASIKYLRETDDFGPAKLVACIVIGLGVTAFAVWWMLEARREHKLLTSQVEKRA
jgi:hypothetical protein